MRPKHLVSIVLIAVVLVMLMRNNNSMTNARPLVYRESLDEVAAQINGEKLTLRDMAFYVGYEEYQIQQEALVYDPDDPNRYWSMRVEGGFMNAVARKTRCRWRFMMNFFIRWPWRKASHWMTMTKSIWTINWRISGRT